MAEQKLVLGYWGIRGLAQPIRYELEYLGLPYDEKKYKDMGEWFGGDNAKEPIKNHCLANLPYLIDGEKYIYESRGIQAYLALKAGRKDLLGETPEEIVRLGQIAGVAQDTMMQFIPIIKDHATFAEKGVDTFKTNVVPYLYTLNKFIEGKKFSVSDKLTLADFNLYELLDTLHAFHPESFEQFPNLKNFVSTFQAIPQIDAYLKSDRFVARPFYPPGMFAWTGL